MVFNSYDFSNVGYVMLKNLILTVTKHDIFRDKNGKNINLKAMSSSRRGWCLLIVPI